MSRRSARQPAIVGYSQSPIERGGGATLGPLTVETARAAIADARLSVGEIDGFTTGSLLPASGEHSVVDGHSIVTAQWLASHIGADPRWVMGFQGIGQLPGSVVLAANAIASGAADCVLVHRALWNPAGKYNAAVMREAVGPDQWTAPIGFWGAIPLMALPYQEYLHRYGADRMAMAAVVVEARRNGAAVPWSYWRGQSFSGDDYRASPMISDPICLHDCDIPVISVSAFVLTTAERARDLPHRPVFVAGHGQGTAFSPHGHQHWTLDDIIEGGEATVRRLWSSSGISIDDVDLPLVYDGFSPLVYFWLEALGICPRGQAHEFVQDGRIASDGGVPILSGGGSLGNGRMHGVAQMLEGYLQLSGRAGDRQRPGAKVALACHTSPHVGGAVVYSSEQLGSGDGAGR